MTKKELIEAMKDLPDDMEVWLEVDGGKDDLQIIEVEEYEYWLSKPLPFDDEHKKGTRIILRGTS